MAHKLPHLLKNRHGTYYLRVYRNGKEYRRSLRTKDFPQAKIHALTLNLELAVPEFDLSKIKKLDIEVTPAGGVKFRDVKEHDLNTIDIVLKRMGLTGEQLSAMSTEELARRLAGSQPAKPALENVPTGMHQSVRVPRTSKLFSAVVDLYLIEKKIDNVPKTLTTKKRAFDEFAGYFQDLDINRYTPEEAVSYKNRLLGENYSGSQINARCSFLRSLFDYAINNNLYFTENPFDKIRISSKSKLKKQVRSYKAFTTDDLKVIFDEPVYRGYLKKADYFWLPFLSLYSGARLEELASLTLDQIYQYEGVWIIDIQHAVAKNKNSIRKIPLHKTILESRFLEFVDYVKAKKEPRLFPYLKGGKGGYGKNTSRAFGKYLDKVVKITDDRKVFHSLRTTFINSMTNLNCHPALLMAIVGHYEQARVDFSSPHFKNYQEKKKPIEILKELIDKLEYPIENFFER